MDLSTCQCSRAAAALALAALLAVAGGCNDGSDDDRGDIRASGTYDWGLPSGFPVPPVPRDNPMSAVKVELGRRLFYDKRLSGNQTLSCASCHRQELAFTDGRATSVGSTGEHTPRSSMSLTNVAYLEAVTWANPRLLSLEEQALVPMLGETPVELGLAGREEELLARLRAEPRYEALFPEAFPEDEDPITLVNVTRAIAAFERTLLSYRSPFDRYIYSGDKSGMSEAALRGKRLVYTDTRKCILCHSFNLDDPETAAREGKLPTGVMFRNTGLYNIDGKGAYPPENTGLFAITGEPTDMGRFRVPTLRNIAVTAPYMHDGSVDTLESALEHYAAGGRKITSGPYAGDGTQNPYKSEFISGFELPDADKADIIEFLKSATDEEFLRDARFADPWSEGR
jgi:cytochrome c peroxidase